MAVGRAGGRRPAPARGLRLGTGLSWGGTAGEYGTKGGTGDGESLGNCRSWWGQGLCWSLIRLIRLSLCPHRRHPHHLLLPLPATARPGGPHRLRLRHQQPLRQARGDVSTHHCRELGLCEGDGDTARDTARDAAASSTWRRHPAAPAECPNVAFLPAAWSPRRRRSCVRTPSSPGCRRVSGTSRTPRSDPSPPPPATPPGSLGFQRERSGTAACFRGTSILFNLFM